MESEKATLRNQLYLGEAFRPGEPQRPAYSWERSRDRAELLPWVSPDGGHPLVVLPVADRQWFWNRVTKGQQQAWEGYHTAIIGVAYSPEGNLVTVYDEDIMCRSQQAVVSDYREQSGVLVGDKVALSVAKVAVRKIMEPLVFGEITPFYIRIS